VSAPSPLVLLPQPALRPLPAHPALPPAPELKPQPPTSAGLPGPKLHPTTPPPIYPPVPEADLFEPPNPFMIRLILAAAVAGIPMYFVAWLVGVIMMIPCGIAGLILWLEERQREKAWKSLQAAHEDECARLREEYEKRARTIQKANKKLIDAWESASAADAADHAQRCKAIDELNRHRIAPWESATAPIKAEHQRVILEVQYANRCVHSAWEAENSARQAAYAKSRREIEQENQRRVTAWNALVDFQKAEYEQNCREIDAKNRLLTASWVVTNAPWIEEQNRWRDRASLAESQINRLERELEALRIASVSRFQLRKGEVDDVLKSHDGTRRDYEREYGLAEVDSKRIQLDEHLDKSLICTAKIKGITGDRIHALESFGIQTAKDIVILNSQKVPGIGPVLSQRLFDWREKLAAMFHPRHGLPESEKNRIAMRYAPVLRPLSQAINAAIHDLEALAASYRAREAEQVKAIAAAVQDLAVAKKYELAMNVE
jgi:hypothetical protein